MRLAPRNLIARERTAEVSPRQGARSPAARPPSRKKREDRELAPAAGAKARAPWVAGTLPAPPRADAEPLARVRAPTVRPAPSSMPRRSAFTFPGVQR